MIAKLLAMWSDALWVDHAIERFGAPVDVRLRADVTDLRAAIRLRELTSDRGEQVGGQGVAAIAAIDRAVEGDLEAAFLRHGDDGLLEALLAQAKERGKEDSDDASGEARVLPATLGTWKRWQAIELLIEGVFRRHLFKPIGSGGSRELARVIYDQFGSPAARSGVERRAADFAELSHSWQVVMWVPPPSMRLKAAGVLVNIDDSIAPLTDHERFGAHRAQEIYDSHRALWRISVYADKMVRADELRCMVVLARLQELLGISVRDFRGNPVPRIEEILGRQISEEGEVSLTEETRIREVCRLAAQGAEEAGEVTYGTIAHRAWGLASDEGLVSKPLRNGFPWGQVRPPDTK